VSDKLKILFLCTGNSCRSQMAEGWARQLKGDVLEAYSAGVAPAGINPLTVKVMAEAGVDISAQHSKGVGALRDVAFDYVVTVCDHARELCPVFPASARMVHAGFQDPAAASGDAERVLAVFRRVRDEIRRFVETLPQALPGGGGKDR
jgi:arsenate reductase